MFRTGVGMGRDCQSQGFLSQGLESQSSKSRDCPKDFCPSPKSPRDLRPMGRLWDCQNSWDCLGLESQGQSRDFGIFYKNMIYSSHFFNMNPYCTQNFAKIDLQNWNVHELKIFKPFSESQKIINPPLQKHADLVIFIEIPIRNIMYIIRSSKLILYIIVIASYILRLHILLLKLCRLL